MWVRLAEKPYPQRSHVQHSIFHFARVDGFYCQLHGCITVDFAVVRRPERVGFDRQPESEEEQVGDDEVAEVVVGGGVHVLVAADDDRRTDVAQTIDDGIEDWY